MAITSLRLTDFRNFSHATCDPCQGLNVFYGQNASGKTSLLEAIHFLGLGRSFRSSTPNRLIRQETNKFSIYSQVVSDSRFIPIGVERDSAGNTRSRLAESDVTSIAAIAELLPLRLINSSSHHLFESGPLFRRKYLDWGLFYHSERFLPTWRNYERVLKQRNAAIRDKWSKRELSVWTEELIKHGLALDAERKAYVALLSPIVAELLAVLLPVPGLLEIDYVSGWPKDADFSVIMQHSYMDELRLGHTQYGPHRADLDIKINGVLIKHILSRGQQKLLICAMILAQGVMLAAHANKKLIYLIDDLPSELDLRSRTTLMSLLSKQQTQLFITAIDGDPIGACLEVPTKVFHVEHGCLREGAAPTTGRRT